MTLACDNIIWIFFRDKLIYRILFRNMYNFGKIFQQEIISKVGDFFVFYHIVFINMLDWISNIQYGSSFTQSKCRAMTCHCGFDGKHYVLHNNCIRMLNLQCELIVLRWKCPNDLSHITWVYKIFRVK